MLPELKDRMTREDCTEFLRRMRVSREARTRAETGAPMYPGTIAPVRVNPPGECYSDHPEDIRTKGSCDYCGGTP